MRKENRTPINAPVINMVKCLRFYGHFESFKGLNLKNLMKKKYYTAESRISVAK